MTATPDFYTNALYPGGDGGCMVGTHDPYPNGIPAGDESNGSIFKVEFDTAFLWKRIWLLNDFTFKVRNRIDYEEDDGTGVEDGHYDLYAEGKFHDLKCTLQAYVSDFGEESEYINDAAILQGFPQRICGRTWETYDANMGPGSGTSHSEGSIHSLLPRVEFTEWFHLDGYLNNPVTQNTNIEDGSGAVVGNCETSLDVDAPIGWADALDGYNGEFAPLFVRLKGSKSDLYFRARATASLDQDPVQLANVAAGGTGLGPDSFTFDMSILGKSVPAFVRYTAARTSSTFSPTSAVYDVTLTVSDFWEPS